MLRQTFISTEAPTPRINPHVLLALALAMAYHCSLSFYTFGRTYDAFVHIFFADHYARAWFDHWDYRWYTGFTMTSYPPGSQQTIALLAPFVGLRTGFVLTQTFTILMVTVGIYRFSCIWVSEEAAGYAALLVVFASSITETIHVFGQLPTTFSLGFLLNALPFAYRWIREGRLRFLLLAWLANAATTAGHHVTTLFGAVFFVAPVIGLALIEAFRMPLPDEPPGDPSFINRRNLRPLLARRLRRILPATLRSGVYGVGLIAILVLVVLPYWLWSRADPITQVSIPHASRDSFIVNLNAGLVFWLIPYGVSLIGLPYAFYKGITTKAWPMTLSLAMLVFLGTGGTTPFPRMLLRGAFDVLTLDRFTFWATITVLPLLGEFVRSLLYGNLARYIREQFGYTMLRIVQIGLLLSYLVASVFVANVTQFRKFQPAPIDVAPIVTFLEKDEHWRWRYLTLGFGDQVAWLSAQTTATSVDGNYHSARRLPELTSTPVERLEGAKYSGIPGIGSLQQFLAVPDKYNLKFVFSNDQFYDPLLYFSGWHRLQRLENGIMVWERADIPALPEVLPRKEIPVYQRVMWGLVPMSALISALLAMGVYLATHLLKLRRSWKRAVEPLVTSITDQAPQPPPAAHLHDLKVFAASADKFFPVTRLPALARRPYDWIDNLLRHWSVLPDDAATAPTRHWQFWLDWMRRIPRLHPVPPTARQVRSAIVLIVAAIGVIGGTLLLLSAANTPQAALEAYYDDLDFRRFDKAYARLDPQTRPSFEQYIIDRSLLGGLVASYGKLDSVEVTVTEQHASRAVAVVSTNWVTALRVYPSSREHDLLLRDGRWYISPDQPQTEQPIELFVRRPELAWNVPLRIGSEDPIPPALDRPELEVLSARLVRHNERYSVAGEVRNRSAIPADVTVAAILYDSAGNELSRYNAQSSMIHKLMPGETTPFRVDFEGVAGARIADRAPMEFSPDAFTPPDLQQPVAGFSIEARAVVTRYDLRRDLSSYDLQVRADANGNYALEGTLYNHGTSEATIPQLLLTYYAADGSVAWVDQLFIEQSIRPQSSLAFRLPFTPPEELETLLTPQLLALEQTAREQIVLPEAAGYAALRLSLNVFYGSNS